MNRVAPKVVCRRQDEVLLGCHTRGLEEGVVVVVVVVRRHLCSVQCQGRGSTKADVVMCLRQDGSAHTIWLLVVATEIRRLARGA